MAVADIDFEGAGGQTGNTTSATNPLDNNDNTVNQEDTTSLNGDTVEDVTGKDGNNPNNQDTNSTDDNDNNLSTGELAVGDSVEVDGTTYTVAQNGDLVDDKGNVFKQASEVAEWLKSVDVEDNAEANDLSLASIQESLGVTITDEQGKPIEFTNDAAGVKSYVDSVIALKSNELQEAAINRLYQDNPLLRQFQDYVQLNGSPRGFGELPDRSGIQLDKDNEAQLIAVIKMAASEFGNKSLNDNYIRYLRDGGGLYDEAKTQLAALIEKDNAVRKEIAIKAEEQRKQEEAHITEYWNSINKIIEGRVIGGYKIPESFTKEVNGQKVVITPNDFFKYISVPVETEDGQRLTKYQRDLAALSDEQYMNRELLDSWLMFTGGTYKDLIDMAVKEEKVRQLRVKSKEHRSTKTVKVIKNSATKSNIDDIVL
jgi:hypothetical protein